jgi:Cytochrome P460
MNRWILAAVSSGLFIAAGAFLFLTSARQSHVLAASGWAPAYDRNGNLIAPARYREWTYLTSGIDMSYVANSASDHSMFDNVFVNPEAYQRFLKTGTWPDKTIMVLEVRGAMDRGSINLRGHYQGTNVMGIEVHVKDEARFPSKWAFFEVDSAKGIGTLIPQGAPCYSCHAEHGAVDTTFVQFYPTLLPIAQQKLTLSAAFQRETALTAKP